MSEFGPIWHIPEPVQSYPDGRFDGPTHGYPTYPGTVDRQHGPAAYPGDLPSQPYEVVDTSHLDVAGRVMRPLDPQQPTPEQIADAARDALADMQLVLRIWPYYPLSPLTWMRALVTKLTPLAPEWQAKDEDE